MVGDLPPAEARRIQALSGPQFAQLWTKLRARNAACGEQVLKARCRTDRRVFARYFFHEKLADERTGDPIPFSRFHLAALDAPKRGYRERGPMEGWHRARMGPRGNGKTTVFIRIELCHDIVYELERYIVVLAESATLARSRVFEIAVEIEQNQRLRHFFGDLVGDDVWQRAAGHILTANGVTLLARSMESQVRGFLHPVTNARPTKFVLDDAEDSRDVLNPELRARDRRRLSQDIEGAGSIDGSTNFQFTGTPLHREALLPSLAQNAAWDFRAYPAVESWPERMDLWERCRELWAAAGAHDPNDPSDEEPRQSASLIAQRFYRAHKADMDRGVRVLWPEREPFLQLMLWRWTNGEAAFWKEKMFVPKDEQAATFDVDRIVRHRIEPPHLVVLERSGATRRVRLDALRFVAFHDPAKADPKARRSRARADSDYAAIVVIGVEDREAGGRVGHVVEAWLRREKPSRQIEVAFEIAERWAELAQRAPYLHVVESDTLGLIGDEYRRVRRERREKGLFAQLALRSLERQTENKDARIATLEPAYTNGWLTWNVALPAEFVNQHIDHPTGDHDDGPDATEGAWRAASKRRAGMHLVHLGE